MFRGEGDLPRALQTSSAFLPLPDTVHSAISPRHGLRAFLQAPPNHSATNSPNPAMVRVPQTILLSHPPIPKNYLDKPGSVPTFAR